MLYTACLTIIDYLGSFVSFFFTPLSALEPVFGEGASLFTVILGAGLVTFVIYTIAKWIIP